MSVPIPSFFKIRLVLLLIGFFVLFFVVGLVRDVFGACPNGEGSEPGYILLSGASYATQELALSACDIYGGCQYKSCLDGDPCDINWYLGGYSFYDTYNSLLPSGDYEWRYFVICSDSTCLDERVILSTQCGGDGTYYINDETCEGHCTPIAECAAEYEQKIVQCGGVDKLKDWNNSNCTGQCTSCRDKALVWAINNCGSASYLADYQNPICDQDNNYIPPSSGNPCLTCSDAQSRCESKCGGTGNIEVFNCNDSQSGDGYQHIHSYTCNCLQPPKNCNDFRLGCEQKCGGSGLIEVYFCEDDKDPSTRICRCPSTPPEEGTAPPINPPDDPDNIGPSDPPDSDITDSGLLSAIEQNTRSNVQNTNVIGDQLSVTNQKLNWIGDNNKIVADNTAIIGNKLNSVVDAINNQNGNNLHDDTAPILQDISDGSFTQPSNLIPYENGKYEYNFADRFNEFIGQMETTGILSLPNSIIQSIPSYGSPIMTIDAGQYGTHDFDFSNWGNALLVLRSVCLIIFSWVGIRIVLLKR